jgi:hypothetical protein
VGKPGTLGGGVRCVVSVSMLTEGWDANTVTHVFGVRAFGTQLLCEQVIGRALRRQSYDLGPDGLFPVEYADVFGIPFDFTAKPVVAAPQEPRKVTAVKAVSPDRDHLEIRFPRVEGYRTELPGEHISAWPRSRRPAPSRSRFGWRRGWRTRPSATPAPPPSSTSYRRSNGSPRSGSTRASTARGAPRPRSSTTTSSPRWPASGSRPRSRSPTPTHTP